MKRFSLRASFVLGIVWATAMAQASAARSASVEPVDSGARKTFAKAAKEFEDRKYTLALSDFRKADSQDGGRCVSCEMQAYKAAEQMQDYKTAREEADLMLVRATTPQEQAEAHYLKGNVCLSEGGYRIFDKPFQEADSEFQAALQLQPEKPNCLYENGVALAHLHQYDKARDRFLQYIKLATPGDSNIRGQNCFRRSRNWRGNGPHRTFV